MGGFCCIKGQPLHHRSDGPPPLTQGRLWWESNGWLLLLKYDELCVIIIFEPPIEVAVGIPDLHIFMEGGIAFVYHIRQLAAVHISVTDTCKPHSKNKQKITANFPREAVIFIKL